MSRVSSLTKISITFGNTKLAIFIIFLSFRQRVLLKLGGNKTKLGNEN